HELLVGIARKLGPHLPDAEGVDAEDLGDRRRRGRRGSVGARLGKSRGEGLEHGFACGGSGGGHRCDGLRVEGSRWSFRYGGENWALNDGAVGRPPGFRRAADGSVGFAECIKNRARTAKSSRLTDKS